jgi:hypothetical protein
MSLHTFGTHNLHDHDGVPTFFADVVLFTEAIPSTIRGKARARRAHLGGRLSGYTIRVCPEQRDLVIALRRRHYRVTGTRYLRAHHGRSKVTPHRGTYAVETRERRTGRRVVFIVEHRINAAFPPHIRGEASFRTAHWKLHTTLTSSMIYRYLGDGWEVRVGGDTNTPARIKAYDDVQQLHEWGNGLDRLASSEPIHNGERLTRKQSDHPRIRAVS